MSSLHVIPWCTTSNGLFFSCCFSPLLTFVTETLKSGTCLNSSPILRSLVSFLNVCLQVWMFPCLCVFDIAMMKKRPLVWIVWTGLWPLAPFPSRTRVEWLSNVLIFFNIPRREMHGRKPLLEFVRSERVKNEDVSLCGISSISENF